jgi:3-deoxy-D-manno-octulosonic-acid transferase
LSRLLYSAAWYVLAPIALARLMLLSLRESGYRQRWWERFGWVRPLAGHGPVVWLHAVSVGEARAGATLLEKLREEFPQVRILFTTTTPSGAAIAARVCGGGVEHRYFPYDLPGVVRRFVARVRPALLLVMDTELWPNLIAHCDRQRIPVVITNGRISTRSARGYRLVRSLIGESLATITLIAAQSDTDARRFVELGAAAERVSTTGTVKFDAPVPCGLRAEARSLRRSLGDARGVFIAASVHPGEDGVVLDAHARVRAQLADTLLVIVPRHPRRAAEIDAMCRTRGLRVLRHSSAIATAETDVYIGDTLGELLLLYAVSDVAFVGGSLVPIGGHNLLEPAALEMPLLCGPHTENFRDVVSKLGAAGALEIVTDAESLAARVLALLQSPQRRLRAGGAARGVVEANRGALERLFEGLRPVLTRAISG